MSHSRKKNWYHEDLRATASATAAKQLRCPSCGHRQTHHGLCLDCQRAKEAADGTVAEPAADTGPAAVADAAEREPVVLPPPQPPPQPLKLPLGTALAFCSKCGHGSYLNTPHVCW